uniref:Nicotinamide N-methyltransferase n=1 Tax=Leptobrachium leishanense TaxID=445787 RepID=A0A8C5R7I3_9ANUR
METTCCKSYDTDDVDAQFIYDNYFCAATDNDLRYELVDFPIKVIWKCVKLGFIKGDRLIDLSVGSSLYQLVPCFKGFKDITILEVNNGCIDDMEKWVKGEANSYDWAHAIDFLAELEGCSDVSSWKDMENDLRSRVTCISKCDFSLKNPTEPNVLEQVDCIINLYVLGTCCKTIDDYSLKLNNMSTLLKLGGSLILVGGFHASYYTVNDEKFNILDFEKEDLLKILEDGGYRVEHIEVTEKKSSADFITYDNVFVVCAVKVREC